MRLIDADALYLRMAGHSWWNNTDRDIALDDLERMPTSDPKPQWIPVSERLPEKYEDVLITYRIANEKAARIWIGYRAELGWCAYGVYRPNITAWMPMPEAYEPDGVEQDGE